MEKFWQQRTYWGAILAIAILCAAIFTPVTHRIFESDLVDHASRAILIQRYRDFGNTSYPLYHMTFLPVYNILASQTEVAANELPRDIMQVATNIVIAPTYIATAIVIFTSLIILLPWELNRRMAFLYGFLAIGLLLVGPLSVFLPNADLFYGYQIGNEFHSPTSQIMKPFAVILFFLVVRLFDKRALSWQFIVVLAGFSVITLFAKPSYTFVLLPAMCLLAAWYFLRNEPVQWKALILGFIVPSVAVLGLQYLYTFESRGNGIGIDPLYLVFQLGLTVPETILKHLLSIVFPLALVLVYWSTAIRDRMMTIAWTTFMVATSLSLILVETGARELHRNFNKPVAAAIFMLFIACTVFFLRQIARSREEQGRLDWRVYVCGALWIAHLLNGIFFYALLIHTGQPAYYW